MAVKNHLNKYMKAWLLSLQKARKQLKFDGSVFPKNAKNAGKRYKLYLLTKTLYKKSLK